MQVDVKDNTDAIKKDVAIKANIFLRLVADEVVKVAEPNTPMSDGPAKGNLRRNVLRQVLGLTGKITWGENYAAYMEDPKYTGRYKNFTTPGTGPHFAENAIKTVYNQAQELMKKAGLI